TGGGCGLRPAGHPRGLPRRASSPPGRPRQARDQRNLVSRQPEQQALAVHLYQCEKPLVAEVAVGDHADRVRARLALAAAQHEQNGAEDQRGGDGSGEGHFRPVIRSDGLITSVRRTPNLSFTITASPRAMGLPLTRTSSGSPATLASSTTAPGPRAR